MKSKSFEKIILYAQSLPTDGIELPQDITRKYDYFDAPSIDLILNHIKGEQCLNKNANLVVGIVSGPEKTYSSVGADYVFEIPELNAEIRNYLVPKFLN